MFRFFFAEEMFEMIQQKLHTFDIISVVVPGPILANRVRKSKFGKTPAAKVKEFLVLGIYRGEVTNPSIQSFLKSERLEFHFFADSL